MVHFFSRYCWFQSSWFRHLYISFEVCNSIFNLLNICRNGYNNLCLSTRSVRNVKSSRTRFITEFSSESKFSFIIEQKRCFFLVLSIRFVVVFFYWANKLNWENMRSKNSIEIGSVCRTKHGVPVYYKVGKL